MVNIIKSWFERIPELFEREKRIMASLGFELDMEKLHAEKQVLFRGASKCNIAYPLEFIYPSGFPSFPPTVICNVPFDLLLTRHHSPDTKVLCCFGFNEERWNSSYSGLDVFLEVESLISDYLPGTRVPQHDLVPEPVVKYFDYLQNAALLIPPPFGKLDYGELRKYPYANIRLNKYGKGIVVSLESKGGRISLIRAYEDWFHDTTIYKAKVIVAENPPPSNAATLTDWLEGQGQFVGFRNQQISYYLIIFPDEWGKRGLTRPTWILIKMSNRMPSWIRCFSINDEDTMIRNPSFSSLKRKKALLIGAGSVGSSVATALAQEGIGELTIIDPDIYEPSNSIRHQVGQSWFGFNKVEALKERINSLSPETIVTPLTARVGNTRRNDNEYLMAEIIRSDIVIDTTGSHSVTHYMNSLCMDIGKPFLVGTVTNGAWSSEVITICPGDTGCWICWNMQYGMEMPPSEPMSNLTFAPGCNQPTFSGGVSNIIVAAGFIVQAAIDVLLKKRLAGQEYLVWHSRNKEGERSYGIECKPITKHPNCNHCKRT
ncbi:ThiF family adenylyltransferase [Cohnella sp. REN36]|uniref:ThiF family adenylyltransferase n=1 Tax=Cohnella sp. REN36 TaxID=2887347 RepID=UPI001D136A33|nr:ThiF family adenylyltransferase [Cohnella sp. REN36]MCC3377148.1 ThiF family adenylyltransferase [Cohnella sp. REN36]